MVGVLIINHFLNYTCIVLFIQHISVCVGSLQGPRSLEPPLSHSTLSSSFPSYLYSSPSFPSNGQKEYSQISFVQLEG